MARRPLVGLLLVSASLLVALVLAEGLSRMIIGPPSREFQVYDKDLGWRNEPDASGWRVTIDYTHWEQINQRGIRGNYVTAYERSEDAFRILVLGDSFTEGAGVSDDEMFSAVLSKRLNDAADDPAKYEVMNFGVSGYSTDQEFLLFEKEGAKYNPDLTILAFVYNDLDGNVASYSSGTSKPRFELHLGKPESLDQVLEFIPNPPRPDESTFLKLKKRLRQHSRLYTLAAEAVHKLQFTREFLAALRVIDPSNGEPPERPFRFFDQKQDEAVENAWLLTEILISQLRDSVECNGGLFWLVYIPPSFSVHDEDWERFVDQFGEGYGRHLVRDRLQEAMNRQGIQFLDLTPQLSEEAAREGDRMYYRHDTHWTSAGHAVLAAELHKWIEQRLSTSFGRGERREESCPAGVTAAMERHLR